jgi:hypothetical protein
LNLIGIRVYRNYCQLVSRIGGEWMPIGPPRSLPLTISSDPEHIRNDALLATVDQYEREWPGSDLTDLLTQRKSLGDVLNEEEQTNAAGH